MYEKTIKLNDNERAAIVNDETGEVRDIPSVKSNNPDQAKFKQGAKFVKMYPEAWEYLRKILSPLELKVAIQMSSMVKMNTNSLEPLDDDMTIRDLSTMFDVSTGRVRHVLDKLFTEGVYGKFEVYNVKYKHTKYWVFNPYLATNGKSMSKLTANLFSDTMIAKLAC